MATTDPAKSPVRPEVQRLLDHAVHQLGVPGIAVEVRDGEDVRFGTAGVADLDTGSPRELHQQFRVGSAAKAFTATVVLQLAAERLLDLEDTVEKWLPGIVHGDYDGRAITIRQLLAMTSGLFIYTMDEELVRRFLTPAFLEHRFDHFTPEELVEFGLRNPPHHAPGAGWTYTNTGYVLAARIVEQATGSTFTRQLTERILDPLGLERTYLPDRDTTLRDAHTRHYSKLGVVSEGAPFHDITEMSASIGWSAGGIVSTLPDLGTLIGTLLRGDLLPPAQLEQMCAVMPTPPGKWLPNTGYGLGMAAFDLPSGRTVWGNGGAINGSFCLSLGSRDGRRVVTQHVNTDFDDSIFETFLQVLDAEFAAAAELNSTSRS
jgi:D-alanyl-D-alanine carboxypeptidase